MTGFTNNHVWCHRAVSWKLTQFRNLWYTFSQDRNSASWLSSSTIMVSLTICAKSPLFETFVMSRLNKNEYILSILTNQGPNHRLRPFSKKFSLKRMKFRRQKKKSQKQKMSCQTERNPFAKRRLLPNIRSSKPPNPHKLDAADQHLRVLWTQIQITSWPGFWPFPQSASCISWVKIDHTSHTQNMSTFRDKYRSQMSTLCSFVFRGLMQAVVAGDQNWIYVTIIKLRRTNHDYFFVSSFLVSEEATPSVRGISSTGRASARWRGNCSQGDSRSNFRNSWVISRGSYTTRWTSSSYRHYNGHEKKEQKSNTWVLSKQQLLPHDSHWVESPSWTGDPRTRSQLIFSSGQDGLRRKRRTCHRPLFHTNWRLWRLRRSSQEESVHPYKSWLWPLR